MIHTVIEEDIKKLDLAVNDFMAERGQNLPVRTEVFVIDEHIYHKATIFWDERMTDKRHLDKETGALAGNYGEEPIGEPNKAPPKTFKKTDIGALWEGDTGNISGKLNDEHIVIPPSNYAALRKGEDLHLTIRGEAVVIKRNKYQKDKQPNYRIYPEGA